MHKKSLFMLSVIFLFISSTSFVASAIGFSAIWTDNSGETIEVNDLNYNFDSAYTIYIYQIPVYRTETIKCMFLPLEYQNAIIGIPFKNIDQVDHTGSAMIVKLINGTLLNGKLARVGESNQSLCGSTELGSLCLPMFSMEKIVFNHALETSSSIGKSCEDSDLALGFSNLSFYIETWENNTIKFSNATIFELYRGFKWTEPRTGINLKLGDASFYKDLNDIESINFYKIGVLYAQVTFTSGDSRNLTIAEDSTWIGGNFNDFGPARIDWNEIKSLTIDHN